MKNLLESQDFHEKYSPTDSLESLGYATNERSFLVAGKYYINLQNSESDSKLLMIIDFPYSRTFSKLFSFLGFRFDYSKCHGSIQLPGDSTRAIVPKSNQVGDKCFSAFLSPALPTNATSKIHFNFGNTDAVIFVCVAVGDLPLELAWVCISEQNTCIA